MTTTPEFDKYADNYDSVLTEALSLSGEDKSFFARGRIAWLAGCLRQLKIKPISVLDYGCGTGAVTPLFRDLIGASLVLGTDISRKSLEVAKQTYGSEQTQFFPFDQYKPNEQIDLAFCNGVFHHIPLSERLTAINYIYRSLRPGGLFAFWENNPWNPGTLYVMSQCVFDDDAITLSPPEARSLLCSGGFKILRTDFLFIFPRLLRCLRPIEPLVSRLPLGTQYQVLCQKPC
jgi:SAM-dependent methyltransferase